MAMTATQQAAAGIGQSIFTACQQGTGYDEAYLFQLVGAAILILALSAGGNTPALTGTTGLPTVLDAAPVAIPGR
jgi:hypothetical protein